jgi:flagellar hook-associated protein 3 FlgL
MKAQPISTIAVSLALRGTTASLQSQLPRLQTEMVTGKYADSGLALGAQSRRLVSFVSDISHTGRLIDTNSAAMTRLKVTQAGMTQMNGLALELMSAVGIVLGHSGQNFATELTASNVIAETTAILNSQVNGVFLFSGINADNKPIADYETGPAKAAFDTAFFGYFGFNKNDPAASSITRTDIETFITTAVEPLYLGAGWTANTSSATDEVTISRISTGVTAETSVSANETSIRRLMLGAVVADELFDSNLGGEALQGVAEYVIGQAGSAAGGLTEVQGRIGIVEERLSRANEALTAQKSLLEIFAAEMEAVDPYKTSIELNTMLTQIETSYAITARIQKLSLMNFL